jgi:hypothetical protein
MDFLLVWYRAQLGARLEGTLSAPAEAQQQMIDR